MNPDPWASYWKQSGVGCLPEATTDLARVLIESWQEFGQRLRPGARVLDLATGDGAVLRALIGCGRKLKLIGVDSAPDLPRAPSGIQLKAGVAMERLPFPPDHFDAVTSQFGVEYGDTAVIASETARVLKSGGALRFILHDQESAIVAHNRFRRTSLRWALLESGLLDRAKQLARARRAARLPTPAWFRASVEYAASRFPGQSAGVEFATAVVQTLDLGASRPPTETLEVLTELQARAEGEIGRLEALEAAACDGTKCELIGKQLAAAGLASGKPQILSTGGDRIGWLLDASA